MQKHNLNNSHVCLKLIGDSNKFIVHSSLVDNIIYPKMKIYLYLDQIIN